MDKEYRFIDKLGRHINWNSLIPPLLDTWFAVSATKDMKSGEIVVRVVDAPETHDFIESKGHCSGHPLDKHELFSPHLYCDRCANCLFENCTGYNAAVHRPRDRGLSALNAIQHPDVQALIKEVTEQQLEIDRLRASTNPPVLWMMDEIVKQNRKIDVAKATLRDVTERLVTNTWKEKLEEVLRELER